MKSCQEFKYFFADGRRCFGGKWYRVSMRTMADDQYPWTFPPKLFDGFKYSKFAATFQTPHFEQCKIAGIVAVLVRGYSRITFCAKG